MEKSSGTSAVMAAVLIWGLVPFALKGIMGEFPPTLIVAIRFLIAGFLLLLFIPNRRRMVYDIKSEPKDFFMFSFLGVTAGSMAYVYAVKMLPVGIATLIGDSYPAFTIVLGGLMLKEEITPRHVLGLTSALLGLVIISNPEANPADALSLAGIAFASVACISWSFSGVFGKKLSNKCSSTELASAKYIIGGMMAIPFVLLTGELDFSHVTTGGIMMLLVLSALSAVANYAYYFGLARMSLTAASILESMIPVVTLFVGYLAFSQRLTSSQILGAVLIVLGMLLASYGQGADDSQSSKPGRKIGTILRRIRFRYLPPQN